MNALPCCNSRESYIIDPTAYPKVSSWKPDGKSCECCSWDGVECDEESGHVVSLSVTSSCLHGSINSNSSLFHLVYLERLSLADNIFNDPKISSAFSNFLRLSHLDLSQSGFSGQLRSGILELSSLVSLDLSRYSLKLRRSLVEKLTHLEVLSLSEVDISSSVPQALANLSSLRSLFLHACRLHGKFPSGFSSYQIFNFLV